MDAVHCGYLVENHGILWEATIPAGTKVLREGGNLGTTRLAVVEPIRRPILTLEELRHAFLLVLQYKAKTNEKIQDIIEQALEHPKYQLRSQTVETVETWLDEDLRGAWNVIHLIKITCGIYLAHIPPTIGMRVIRTVWGK